MKNQTRFAEVLKALNNNECFSNETNGILFTPKGLCRWDADGKIKVYANLSEMAKAIVKWEKTGIA